MRKSDINVLIIDDEVSLAEPMTKALFRNGYNSKHVKNYEDSLREVQVKDYQLLIIDCMLPKINGIEIATKLKQKLGDKIKILLISGIFKDNGFKKDAIEKTKATGFLEKPFEIEDLLEKVNKVFEDVLSPELPPLYQMFHKNFQNSSENQLEIIRSQETIHGFEIPLLLSILNAAKANGDLTLKSLKDPIVVKLKVGQIYQVESNDKESYFGVLLIENGFATPEEVAKGLSLSSHLPIGQRLWSTNTLSPHAIDLVHQEQLSIRLSKSIQAETYSVSFQENASEKAHLIMTNPSFHRYLNDWLSTKIKTDWLHSFMTPWMTNYFQKGPNYSLLETLKKIALVSLSPNLAEIIVNKMTLSEVITNNKNKPFLLQSLYFLLLLEIIKFSEEKITKINYQASIQRIKDLKESFIGKNYYQLLGVEKHFPKERIQQAFHNYAIYLHPDKLASDAPEELQKLTKEAFQILSEAHQTLTNSQTREKYNFELEHGQAERIIKSENLYERGLMLLNNNKYNEACECFDEVYKINLFNNDFLVYYCWALMKRATPASQRPKLLSVLDDFISRIPTEARHNSSYFYVKGLYLKARGNYEKALIAFKHSFTLNPDFKPAHIEWMSVENKLKNSSFSLKNMFKRKSS